MARGSSIQRRFRPASCFLSTVGGLLGGRRFLSGGAGFFRKPVRLTSLRSSGSSCAFRNGAQAGGIALGMPSRNEIRTGGCSTLIRRLSR